MARAPSLTLGLRFTFSTKGASAIEFAVAFPVLLLLMLAGTQVVSYINAVRKVEQVAASIAEMMSQAAPPSSATTTATINAADIHFGYESALVIFPYVIKDASRQNLAWWQDLQISFASIQFTQTSSSCATARDKSSCYLANVVWTSTLNANNRP